MAAGAEQSLWLGRWVAGVTLGVHLFVVFYEEPTLRGKFGADYEEYCRNVSRWWPRVRGWDKPQR